MLVVDTHFLESVWIVTFDQMEVHLFCDMTKCFKNAPGMDYSLDTNDTKQEYKSNG